MKIPKEKNDEKSIKQHFQTRPECKNLNKGQSCGNYWLPNCEQVPET